MRLPEYLDLSAILIAFYMMWSMAASVANSSLNAVNSNGYLNNYNKTMHHYHQHHHHQHKYHPIVPQRSVKHKNSLNQITLMPNRKLSKKKLHLKSSIENRINSAATVFVPLKKASLSTNRTTSQSSSLLLRPYPTKGDENRVQDDYYQHELNNIKMSKTQSGNDYEKFDNNYNSYRTLLDTVERQKTNHFHGDDNRNDIEFISANNINHILPHVVHHNDGPKVTTTTLIPPLVPVRRGYKTIEPENPTLLPNNINSIDLERRHICVQQRTVIIPEKKFEIYNRPILRHVSVPCEEKKQGVIEQMQQMHQIQRHIKMNLCTKVQLIHEPSFRDVIHHKSTQQLVYECCNGWSRETVHSDSCMKPICSISCHKGGTCTGPDICNCTVGYRGRYCERDIDECVEKKLCDQICVNTIGSYYCRCRDGFHLEADQQSCRKIEMHIDDAFEARDMEHDIINMQEGFIVRIQKIEKALINERVHTINLEKTLNNTYNTIDVLKSRLANLDKQQYDMKRLQINLYNMEKRLLKLEGMFNLLMKCRYGPNANCP